MPYCAGGCWKNFTYCLKIPIGYKQMNIVNLEMVNIVLAVKCLLKHFVCCGVIKRF